MYVYIHKLVFLTFVIESKVCKTCLWRCLFHKQRSVALTVEHCQPVNLEVRAKTFHSLSHGDGTL